MGHLVGSNPDYVYLTLDVPQFIDRDFGNRAIGIVQTGLIGVPGSGRCAPSLVVWRCTGSYDGAWRRSLRCNGRRSRSPAG